MLGIDFALSSWFIESFRKTRKGVGKKEMCKNEFILILLMIFNMVKPGIGFCSDVPCNIYLLRRYLHILPGV